MWMVNLMRNELSDKQKKLECSAEVSGRIKTPYKVDVLKESYDFEDIRNQVCSNCKYWKETIYDYGICSKIGEKLEIDLILGWDGGHVNFIETENDFGCNQFEEKIKSNL